MLPLPDDTPPTNAICAPFSFSPPSNAIEFIFGPGTGNGGQLNTIIFPPIPFEGTSILESASMTASIQIPPSEPTIGFFMVQIPGSLTPIPIATDSTSGVDNFGFGHLAVFHVAEGKSGYAGASDQVTISGTLTMVNRCPDNTSISTVENYSVNLQLKPL